MKNEELYHEDNYATYCPEDDKLRLYIGRVPREEYLALKKEGWTSTPKQACDFVAVWTPQREDTALSYAGEILDEDELPQDRAADRAERFAGYRDKRTAEAIAQTDRYEAAPRVYGYQDKGRAARAADRVDRIAGRAVNAWEKAEYWTQRTAGVIANALYRSRADVRMGRIKSIESDIRRIESYYTPANEDRYTGSDGVEYCLVGQGRALSHVPVSKLDAIRASYARTIAHLRNRLAYENQMLEAQGGRAAALEIEKGGTFRGKVIAKVNKSTKTGRVVSVDVIGPKVDGWAYKVKNVQGTEYALYNFETERADPGAYSPPTDESRAKLAEYEAAIKAGKKKAPAIPLINPTPEDAEKLQAIWNATKPFGSFGTDREKTPLCITQAQYSANSKGEYAQCSIREIKAGGAVDKSFSSGREEILCKIRSTYGRVIVLTDKPQKPLPAAVLIDPRPQELETIRANVKTLVSAVEKRQSLQDMTEEERKIFNLSIKHGLAYMPSVSQFGLTKEGQEFISAAKASA